MKEKKKLTAKKNYCNAKGREILKRKIKKSKNLTAFVFLLLSSSLFLTAISSCFDGIWIEWIRFPFCI